MKRKFIAILMVLCIGTSVTGMVGCSVQKNSVSNVTSSKIAVSSGEKESVGKADTYIELGASIKVDGNGAVVSDNKVTINAGGTYSISGDISDGQIVVEASKEEKVYIILNGVNITCSNSAPIYVKQCDKTIISLAEGTENIVTDGSEYVYDDEVNEEPNAAIFSKDDLVFIGEGSLTVNANFNNGITSKDDLKIEGGNITVNAKADGVRGKDSVIITDGNLTVTSGEDGIKSNNTTDTTKGYVLIEGGKININSQEDGIQAETNLYVRNGEVSIVTRGGSENNTTSKGDQGMPGMPGMPMMQGADAQSAETSEEDTISSRGLKAGNTIIIEGGTFDIDSYEDAIHSNDIVNIVNGTFNISAGDDGIHADSELTIDNGKIDIIKSYEGIEGETITINDGEINLVSTDDGINASGGSTEEETEAGMNTRMIQPEGNVQGGTAGAEGAEQMQNRAIGNPPAEGQAPGVESAQSQDAARENKMHGQMGGGMESSGTGVININGGKIVVDAAGDGIDVNGSAYMNGGTVIVHGPTNGGNGALDYDNEFIVNGGTLIAVGSIGMVQAPGTDSTQNSVNISLASQESGKLIRIEDESGNEVLTFAPEKQYSSVVVCSEDLKTGSTYKVYLGGSAEGEGYRGLYSDSNYTKGEEIAIFTVSDKVTNVTQEGVTVSSGRGGGMGGQRGEGGRGNKQFGNGAAPNANDGQAVPTAPAAQ